MHRPSGRDAGANDIDQYQALESVLAGRLNGLIDVSCKKVSNS